MSKKYEDGSIRQLFSVLKQTFIEIFKDPKDNPFYERLGIKKDFFASIRYAFYLLITLPLQIFNMIINVDYRFYLFTEKLSLSIFWIFGRNNLGVDVLSKNYERYVKSLLTNSQDAVVADLSGTQAVIDFFRGFKIISTIIFAVVFMFILAIGIDTFSNVLGFIVGKVTAVTATSFLMYGGGIKAFFASMGLSMVLWLFFSIVFLIFFTIFFMYLMYVLFKIIVININAVLSVSYEDFSEFVVNAIDFEIKKTKELYGEDVAEKALNGLIENFVSKDGSLLIEDLKEYKKLLKG